MKNEHLFLISFGDSAQYKLPFADSKEALQKSEQIVSLERELKDYLNAKFPESTVTYYVSPKIIEIPAEHAECYESYPVLDKKAVEDIKKRLVKGVEDMESLHELNDNAPYANID